MKHLFLITGSPGIGKTTVLLRTVEVLEKEGIKIGGMVSREVREEGSRVGFEILDFATKKRGWLAQVNQPTGPQVGRYRVNLRDLEVVGAESIRNAVARAQVIIIDEVGPMELHSLVFKEAVVQALDSSKPVLGVIHQRARDQLIDLIRRRADAEIIEITYANRENVHKLLIDKVTQLLKKREDES